MSRFLQFSFFVSICLFAEHSEEMTGVRRVRSHILLEDQNSALKEAKELNEKFPDSKEVLSVYIEALSASGQETLALQSWHQLSTKYPDLAQDRNLLENLAWGVLKKGLNSTQYGVRLASLIGSFLTNDVRALPILKKMMQDSNAVVRSVAVQMASQYRDAPLQDEISRMMKEEKVWVVKLEVIKAAGILRMKSLAPTLKTLIQSENTTYEERQRAIEALCNIYEEISFDEWITLSHSSRAGMRHFACNIAAHFQMDEAKEEVLRLFSDSHPDVRIAAINAYGLYFREGIDPEKAKEKLETALQDTSAEVAITAAWASLISGLNSEETFQKWLQSPYSEHRRLAAAALSASGSFGRKLSSKVLKESEDPYVRANLAVGLLGQREDVLESSNEIYTFLETEKRMWMWDTRPNPLFQTLSPSQVRHVDHIPNYPEAIDQMTRLNLLSLLALVEHPKALDAVKSFLKKKSWGITGVAAATLLQEGDENSLEVVRALLEDQDPNIRLQACFVLSSLGRDETVIDELQKAYASSDHEKKLHILEAMGRICKIESIHFLVGAFHEPFPILRVAAAAALIQSIHR